MPALFGTELCIEQLKVLDAYLEERKLIQYAHTIAFKRYKGSIPLLLVGLPTHHSNLVAFQTPATPIM